MQTVKELIKDGKLKQAVTLDMTQLPEDGKEAVYNYYRGQRNDTLINFCIGNCTFQDDGLLYSQEDFDGKGEVLAEHRHTIIGRSICEYLGIDNQKDLTKFWRNHELILEYWW